MTTFQRTLKLFLLAAALGIGSCTTDPSHPLPDTLAPCPQVEPEDALSIPLCLLAAGTITPFEAGAADSLLRRAAFVQDSLARRFDSVSVDRSERLTRSLGVLPDFFNRGLLTDSARFNRVLDHIAVTLDFATNTLQFVGGRAFPARTPWLSWHLYSPQGLYFQPVETAQLITGTTYPRPDVPLDSLLGIVGALYNYAIWRDAEGVRFPVWEYEFTWTSGGVTNPAPWVSAQAQGRIVSLFAEAYRRTGDPVWRDRAFEVLRAFRVSWASGGVRMGDTTHGYWWEEFNPVVQVYNGSVQAALDLGFVESVLHDAQIEQAFGRGIEAIKYYTQFYDTGSWTLYSRTQGLNSRHYHNYHIQLMDRLYEVTGDPWFAATADRWRSYVPPPGY